MQKSFSLSGHIVDVVAGKIFPGKVEVSDGKIISVTPCEVVESQFILPGLIDAHVHIESSMLVPAEFARLAVVHGTTATVSDPHEIANVKGLAGIRYFLREAESLVLDMRVMLSSCVPATHLETNGGENWALWI